MIGGLLGGISGGGGSSSSATSSAAVGDTSSRTDAGMVTGGGSRAPVFTVNFQTPGVDPHSARRSLLNVDNVGLAVAAVAAGLAFLVWRKT